MRLDYRAKLLPNGNYSLVRIDPLDPKAGHLCEDLPPSKFREICRNGGMSEQEFERVLMVLFRKEAATFDMTPLPNHRKTASEQSHKSRWR